MHFSGGNHPCKSFFANQDQFPRWKSSLQELFIISGCISPLEIIPTRAFSQIRMHFPDGNHPYKSFFANQDESPRWKSSLQELFCKSGWISPLEIIPAKHFLQIRMHFPAGNHPCKSFSAYQDAFPRWKSSLQDIFCKSGCISPLEIIPARQFYWIRMHFPAGNHPCKSFSAIQDAFPRRKSSLQELFCNSGSISPLGIIPVRRIM